jgi:hypothetical protein
MGILNSIEGYCIRGENRDAFLHLMRFHRMLEKTSRLQCVETSHAWYNEIDLEACTERLRELYRTVLTGGRRARVFGFKEIRYFQLEREELFDLLDLYDLLAPPSAILVNTRNLDDVLRSGWWAKRDPKEWRATIHRFEENMRDYAASHPNRCFHIDYSDVVEKSERLAQMFEFLGERYDPSALQKVLDTPHSY